MVNRSCGDSDRLARAHGGPPVHQTLTKGVGFNKNAPPGWMKILQPDSQPASQPTLQQCPHTDGAESYFLLF